MKKEQIIIYSPNRETSQAIAEMFERSAALLAFSGDLTSRLAQLDERTDEIKLKADFETIIEEYVQNLVLTYPSPELMQADLTNFLSIRSIVVEKPPINITGARAKGH